MKIRVKDIAKRAGVSSASVSNVLNDKGGVSDATAKRILDIAFEMGYSAPRNYSAPRTIASVKDYVRFVSFKRHGLVVMDTQFFAETIQSLERQCHQAGFKMVISNIHMEKDADYSERIREICQEECAGILLLATEMYPEDIDLFTHTAAPLVVVDSLFRNRKFNCVMMNNEEAGYMATDHLIQMGHTRIEHITSNVQFNNVMYRRKGYESAMEDKGLAIDENSVWYVTPTFDGAYHDMLELISKRRADMPTAFFAANDIIAAGCVRALKEKGYFIPDQVSIIGMDDLSICQINSPTLSTIRVLREAIAYIAVRRLLDLMADDTSGVVQKIQVENEYVERQSVKSIFSA